jgi:hypothetical protein
VSLWWTWSMNNQHRHLKIIYLLNIYNISLSGDWLLYKGIPHQETKDQATRTLLKIFSRYIIFKYMVLMTVSRTAPTELPDASPSFHTFPAEVDDPWPGCRIYTWKGWKYIITFFLFSWDRYEIIGHLSNFW